jgi:two-component system OmpR family response regulator
MKENHVLPSWEPAGAPLKTHTNPPHRILVVEDDDDIRQLNAEVLIRSGYQVDTAEDGEEGWNALHAAGYSPESYDLLITDHDMPGLSGLDLVKKLRAARMALPVIMATGKLPEEEFTQRPWLQPAALLLKPYTIPELLCAVRKVLRAPDEIRVQIAPPDWRDQPSAEGWQ